MRAVTRLTAVVVTVLMGLSYAGPVGAQAAGQGGTDVQDGNNRRTAQQGGTATSGDAVGGAVVGVVSAGATSVDATNASKDSSVVSGDASASNTSRSITGLVATGTGGTASNVQDGNNTSTLTQSAVASTGDGVAGQVIGAVTAPGGSASIVAANTSTDNDVTTGDANSSNVSDAFVGLLAAPTATEAAINVNQSARNLACVLVTGACQASQSNSLSSSTTLTGTTTAIAANTQTGNNRGTVSQSAPASSGDGVAGQVIGVVSAGAASIDARNTSTNNDVTTGDADSSNAADTFVGLLATPAATGPVVNVNQTASNTACVFFTGACFVTQSNTLTATIAVTGTTTAIATNTQDGNNRGTVSQSAPASTGDGVAGQVIGAVTAAGGSASIVAANTSTDNDVTTGDATSSNDAQTFVGLRAAPTATGPVATINQSASNTACVVFTGACFLSQTNTVVATVTVTGATTAIATNTQDGNNRATVSQSAPASTGDGVAGQIIGAVSAGATSIDASNTSTNNDVTTGDADSSNSSNTFVGLLATPVATGPTATVNQAAENIGCALFTGACFDTQTNILIASIVFAGNTTAEADNTQDGNNTGRVSQSAPASTGDGVGGQVIGAVTAAGGSASIVAANNSTNNDVTTGDADSSNASDTFVGLLAAPAAIGPAATISQTATNAGCFLFSGACRLSQTNTLVAAISVDSTTAVAANNQTGDNRGTVSQSAPASTGDGVAGQVLGVVSAGAASVDARNTSTDNDVTTGDADASNSSGIFVGLRSTPAATGGTSSNSASALNISCFLFTGSCSDTQTITLVSSITTGIASIAGGNVQTGDNNETMNQLAQASSGDAIAGQVTGVVTSAGGSASVVVANTSARVDTTSGDTTFDNSDAAFVGLTFPSGVVV